MIKSQVQQLPVLCKIYKNWKDDNSDDYEERRVVTQCSLDRLYTLRRLCRQIFTIIKFKAFNFK